jgi:hypothetical protein
LKIKTAINSIFLGLLLGLLTAIAVSLTHTSDATMGPSVTSESVNLPFTATPTISRFDTVTQIVLADSPMVTSTVVPQKVLWATDTGQGLPGILIPGTDSIPWDLAEREIRQEIFPFIDALPADATLSYARRGAEVGDIDVIDSSGSLLGCFWFGKDPTRDGQIDYLVRYGSASETTHIWSTFQRQSDGTYVTSLHGFGL